MLKNAYLDAKIGVDTAENEPPKECRSERPLGGVGDLDGPSRAVVLSFFRSESKLAKVLSSRRSQASGKQSSRKKLPAAG